MLFLAVVTSVSLCAPATPDASPAPQHLKTIVTVKASSLCTALRKNLAPSIVGLRVNDQLITQGQAMMIKLGADAADQPHGNSAVGGAGAASEMDDFQMSQLARSIESNLERIQALLNDPAVFPSNQNGREESVLAAVRARLTAVMAGQQRALNIIEQTVESNEATDLAAKCDPVDCSNGGKTPARISLRQALAQEFQTEQQAETLVAPALVGVIDLCKP